MKDEWNIQSNQIKSTHMHTHKNENNNNNIIFLKNRNSTLKLSG